MFPSSRLRGVALLCPGRPLLRHLRFCFVFCFSVLLVNAQQYPQSLYQEMRWRMIGPFRGGRTRAVAGVPREANVFYMGVVNGGVWKSNDYGRTWTPIFD